MADYNTGIDAYGNDGTLTSTTIDAQAFLALDVSQMTVQDIKNYIDLLSKQAGYLTASEIEVKINAIADAAGMLTQAEIENLVTTTITNAGAVTTANATALINASVAEAILSLNDNKDYINDVRNGLKQDIDRLRSELRIVQLDGNETEGDVSRLRGDFDYQVQKLTQSINLFESILGSLVENKEVYNLLDVERVTRAQEIAGIQSAAAIRKSDIDTKLAVINATAAGLDSRLTTSLAQTQTSIVTLDSNIRTRMTAIETQLRDSSATLSALLLSGDQLVDKLQALNEVDLGTNGNLILNLQDEIQAVQAEFAALQTQITNYTNELDLRTTEIETLSGTLQADLNDNRAITVNGLDNIRGSLAIEIAERKAADDLIIKEWADYTIEMNAGLLAAKTQANALLAEVAQYPIEMEKIIKLEQQARIDGSVTLDNRITFEVDKLRTAIADVDAGTELSLLNQKLTTIENKYAKDAALKVEALRTATETRLTSIEGALDVNDGLQTSRVQAEATARTGADNALGARITSEASIRETRVQELKDQILAINAMVEAIIVNNSVDDPTPLTVALNDLNSRYNGLFLEVSTLADTHAADTVTLTNRLVAAEASLADVQTTATLDIQSEAAARAAADLAISNAIDVVNASLSDVIGSIATAENNTADVLNALNAFKISFDNDLRTDLGLIEASIVSNSSEIQNTNTALAAEATSREAQYLSLDSAVSQIDAKLPIMENALRAEITAVSTNVATDIAGIQADLAVEIQARTDADLLRSTELDSFRAELTATTNTLTTSISDASTANTTEIGNINTALTAETAARIAADTSIETAIANEAAARVAADDALSAKLDAHTVTINSILSSDDISLANLQAVLEIVKVIDANPDANFTAELLTGLNSIEANLTSLVQLEEDARVQAIISLNASLTTLINSVQASVTAEISDRITADTALQAGINAATTDAIDRETLIGIRIDGEIIDRTQADTNLQNLISAETTRATGEEVRIEGLVQDETSQRIIDINAVTTSINSTNSLAVDNAARATALETKEAALMANLPPETRTLKDLLDIITGNFSLQTTRIDTEVAALVAVDSATDAALATESTNRLLGDTTLQNNLDTEAAARVAADGTLQSNIDAEATARLTADNGILTQISTINTTNTTQQAEIDAVTADLAGEIVDRAQGDADIKFDGLTRTQIEFDAATYKTILELSEAQDATTTELTTTTSGLAQELIDRAAADSTLQGNIDIEAAARISGDGTLQGNLDTVETTLQGNINAEAATRLAADNILQSNIDAIAPRLDKVLEVTDVTGTTYVVDGVETDRIDVITYSNGYTATYVYDATPLLTTIEYRDGTATLVATKAFTYNVNGRLDTTTWTAI